MKSKQETIDEILRLWGNPVADYGDNVVPVMKLYASLASSDERKLFQDALESLLSNKDESIRRTAITQSLGFFAFGMQYNKLLKYTPAANSTASAGQPTLRFGCPLARRYVYLI